MSTPTLHIGQVATLDREFAIYVGRYPIGGALAVQLHGHGPLGEPDQIVFSTNIAAHAAGLAVNEFFAKTWSENECLIEPMLDTGLFEQTGRLVPTGFVFAPVWRILHSGHVPPPRKRGRTADFQSA